MRGTRKMKIRAGIVGNRVCWMAAVELFLLSCLSLWAVPQPGCLFYGLALDEFGWPYSPGDDAEIVFRIDGEECGRYAIGDPIAPGVNFVMMVPVDSGGGDPYTPGAGFVGDSIEVIVDVDGEEKATIATFLELETPGAAVYVKVRVGTDLDEDGLPDEWEQWLVDYDQNDSYTNIVDITPGGDFDGDGAPNEHEYLTGTFPEIAVDYFYVESLVQEASGRLSFDFLSVPGMAYSVQSCTNLMSGGWSACSYSLTPTGDLQSGPFSGDGWYMTVYVEQAGITAFFRLAVE